MTAPVLQQASFRARGDTVGLNVDTWDHALNANFTWEIGDTKRIRFTIAETAGGMANNIAFSLQYNLNGAGFVAIGDAAAVRSAPSGQFANSDPTTQLISSGTFVAGIGVEETTTSNISLQSNRTEIEWSLGLDAAQLATGTNTIVIRVVQGASTVLNNYLASPTATVEKEAADHVDAQPAAGTVSVTGLAPTVSVAADVDAQPGTDAISVTGFAPFVPAGLTERLAPNVVLAASNLKDTLDNVPPTRLADIDEPTDEDDDEWWTAVAPEQDIDVRFGFPSSSGNLVGAQQLRVLIRGTSLPSRDVALELWEDGVKLTSEITEEVASIEGQVVTLTFDSSELSDQTGANVELRVHTPQESVDTWGDGTLWDDGTGWVA